MNGVSIVSLRRFLVLLLCTLLVSTIVVAQAQTGDIRGTVLNASTNEPLIGANIVLQGTMRGAATDFDGAYSIKDIPEGKYTVVARFIGYLTMKQTVEVTAGQTAEVNFLLQQDVLKTDEVVITGLSGAIPREQLGNSIAKVTSEEIAAIPVTSALDALVGKVAGMSVAKSTGTPGTGTYITLRGRRTINGSSEPLYVVDGIPIDNTFIYDGSGVIQGGNRASDIAPGDIESIEVLKGASAAAIYGARAANGVILITTKSGKQAESGKFASINYTGSYSIDEVPHGIDLQTTYGQTVPYAPYAPGTSTSYGAALPAGTPTYDHSMDVFQNAHTLEQSISLSSGTSNLKYLVSGSLTNQTGVVIKSDYTRESIRANITASLFSNFGIKSNTNIINEVINLPQDGSNTSGILLGGLRTPPEFDNSIYLEADGVTQRRFAGYDNPFWTTEFNTYKTELTRVLHTTGFDYDFMEGMKLSGSVGWDHYNQFNNLRYAVGAAAVPGRAGEIDHNRYTNDVINTDLMWTGKFIIEDDYITTLTVGQQLWFHTRNYTYASSITTLPFYDEIDAGVDRDAYSERLEERIYSYYAQAIVTAWDRLTLTGAVRRDAGSTFGTTKLAYYYPKVSVAYRLSEESFMQDLKGIVDELKIRGAWGVAGRIPDVYATNTVYQTAGYYDPWERGTSAGRLGNLGIINATSSGSDEIKPEQTEEIEVGLDVTMLDHRLNLEFNYYKQDVTDLLLYVSTPASTGFTTQYANAGAMWNKGYEFKVEVNPIRGEDFSWTLIANYAKNTNEVTELRGFENSYVTIPGAFAGLYNVAKIGKPLGTWLGGGYQRDASGNIMYSDPNIAGREDNFLGEAIQGAPLYSNDLVEFGNADPDWTGSVRNEFAFLNGDLTASVLIDIAQGQKVWNGTKGALYNFGTAGDTRDRDELWFNDAGQPVINAGTTDISGYDDYTYAPGDQLRKSMLYRYYANGFWINEPFIEDGSYVKLREVSVSYRWRNPIIGLESVVFTFAGRNLKTWTDYTGYDPEINTFANAEGRGQDYFTLPQIRSFKFDISINY
ncbi:MAG: SusC/RagA family TonB-linked outer membrane protein [Bacteroidetes bacterium]|nr:SusC/RagA family TonB-linked outer membrane protein [Bacteroidota bacterium]